MNAITPPYRVEHAGPDDLERLAEIYFLSRLLRGQTIQYDAEDVYEQAQILKRFLSGKGEEILKATKHDSVSPEGIKGFLAYSDHSTHKMVIDYFYTVPQDDKPGSALMRKFLDNMEKSPDVKHIVVSHTDDSIEVYEHYGFTQDCMGQMHLYIPRP
jgi:hypothetical protein